jgi:23S rRNA (pseudouridine1915-N3)-methyltransferase
VALLRIEVINPIEEKPVQGFFADAAREYCKRISRYAKVQCSEGFKQAKHPDTDNQTLTVQIARRGDSLSSHDFASLLASSALSGKSKIVFIVSEQPLHADRTISLSALHIASPLQTVLLLEQVYRAFRIINNEPYHK